MWWNEKLTCKQLLLEGRSIKGTSDKELLELLACKSNHESTHSLLLQEFNSRLIKPQPRPEPKATVEETGPVTVMTFAGGTDY